MTHRLAGDVQIINSAQAAIPVTFASAAGAAPIAVVSADATTSGGVAFLSANTDGAYNFGVTNFGSINVFVEASFNGTFFQPSVALILVKDGVSVNALSASTIATFNGPYKAVRIVANSGSGVYRAALTYR